jgi:CheY-like chemotaxis protein
MDLVLLDIGLPGIDGFEVLRRLPRPLPTKVIAMSAHAHQELADQAIELGCETYLTKPFTPRELVRVVDRHASPRDGAGGGDSVA